MNLNPTKIRQRHIHTNITYDISRWHKSFFRSMSERGKCLKFTQIRLQTSRKGQMSVDLMLRIKEYGKTVQQEFSHHLNSITKWHLGFYQGRLIEYLHGISFFFASLVSFPLSLFCSFVWFCLAVMPIFVVVHYTPMRAALSSLFICFAFRMAWRHIIWKFSNYFTKCRMAKSFTFNSRSVHKRFLVNGFNGPPARSFVRIASFGRTIIFANTCPCLYLCLYFDLYLYLIKWNYLRCTFPSNLHRIDEYIAKD